MSEKCTIEEVKKFIEVDSKSGCILISTNYINTNIKLKIQCKCDNVFETTFYKFKNRNKRQCNKCSGWAKYDIQIAKQEFLKNDLIPLFDEYKSVKDHLKGMTKDGCFIQISLEHLMEGKKPNIFSPFNPYTIENIKFWLNKHTKGFVLLSENYKNNHTKLDFLCSNGHIFSMNWADFQRRKYCPLCSASLGEQRVMNWLNSNNINYTYQYTFDDLIGENSQLYRFDFAILDNVNNLKYLIEYDGELHFKAGRFSKDKQKNINKLKETQERDKIKNEYCKENNIKLLRIPYWDYDNIEEILDTRHSVFFNAIF